MLRMIFTLSALLVAANAPAQAPSPTTAAQKNVVFEATSNAVRPGDSVGLRWECSVAGKVRLDPGGLVMEPKGQMLGFDLDDTVFIPAARALELFNRPGLMEIQLSYKPNVELQSMVN